MLKSCIVLGIDPGSRLTGYGVIKREKDKLTYVASGCVRIQTDCSFTDRLGQIFRDVSEIIHEYEPSEGAIEQVFMHKNPGAALKLGQARGAAICAMINFGMPVAEYSARQIKQAVSAYGAAEKNQVQYMVRKLLNVSGVLQVDAADALGVAICHAHTLRD